MTVLDANVAHSKGWDAVYGAEGHTKRPWLRECTQRLTSPHRPIPPA